MLMMKDAAPKMIYLKDYQAPDYLIPHIFLQFQLDDEKTIVSTKLTVKRNTQKKSASTPSVNFPPLVLHGEELILKKVILEGKLLESSDYECTSESLTIKNVPHQNEFTLEITNMINPSANKALEGLYKSGNVLCTQNEPEGFRRITYFIDRSDVMGKYTTKLIADKKKYPILLANGNEVERGELADGQHFVVWDDPFPKPSYLFAIVAGDLGLVQDSFTTFKGRKIDLRLYCDKGNENKCHFAMESLKKSMKWDEEVYGLEYDLDIYMIVAVDAFNMGAMENKGLNIFNSSCVLSDPKTATDNDFHRVEGVVAHEYFHNWTGNRVTCRDWFQLTLKEGLTVFRDQEFSSDMTSRAVQRIKDVRGLRASQFPEDAGPTAHPIRPDSYMEINNFYTSTVYNKGAEVIRMIHTLIGAEKFRKGMDRYFELFDGQAVTTEDFIRAMEDASGFNFTQFKRWYQQAGTPVVEVKYRYDEQKETFTLKVKQSCPATPGQKEKLPFMMPLVVGLLDARTGIELPLSEKEKILHLSESEQEFIFKGIKAPLLPSLNRNFSAPIKLMVPQFGLKELMFFMTHDSDYFNSWEASVQLAKNIFHQLLKQWEEKKDLAMPEGYLQAYQALLTNSKLDASFKALSLQLPDESYLMEDFDIIPFEGMFAVRKFMEEKIAQSLRADFLSLYLELHAILEKKEESIYHRDQKVIGQRELKNVCLHYLMVAVNAEEEVSAQTQPLIDICYRQFLQAKNMTDEINAFQGLVHIQHDVLERNEVIHRFYHKWKDDFLVINKWFAVQAYAPRVDTLERVQELLHDPAFNIQIPNFVRSLLRTFAANYFCFHEKSGRGYEFIAQMILTMDKINPSMASSLASTFNKYGKLDQKRKELMKIHLEKILNQEGLSKNVFEIVSKNLQQV